MSGIGSGGTDDPMERIRAVFEEPYPALAIPPGTWERIETEARRRGRTRRLRLVGSVAASLLVVGAGAGLLWPRSPAPVAPGGPGPSSSSSVSTTPPPPSTAPSRSPATSPAQSPTSTGAVADGLPKGGPVPKGFVPVSLSGASAAGSHYLYVLGDAPGCGNPVCTSLVRSADGGKSWVGLHAPVAEVGGDTPDAVREIRFATPTDGYAFGPTLFETHDGGDTWTRRPLSDQVLDLAVLGDRVWLVMASCDGNGCSSPQLMSGPATGGVLVDEPAVRIPGPVTVARLTDGGGTVALRTDGQGGTGQWVWRRGSGWRSMKDPCAVFTAFPAQPAALAPAADGSGRVAALCTGDGGRANGEPSAVVTTSDDGGRSWTWAGSQFPVTSGQLQFAVADRDRMVVAGQPDAAGPNVLVSPDGGLNWEQATGDVPPGSFRWLGAGGAGSVYALAGADGLLYRSGSGTSFSSRPIG